MQDSFATVNRRRCCVPDCNSRSVPFSFYKFPHYNLKSSVKKIEAVDRCKEWKRRIGLTEINEHTVVCSRHFTEDDYYFPDNNLKVKRLKQNAVPSVNLGLNVSPPKKKIKSEFSEENVGVILPDNVDDENDIESEDVKLLNEPTAETLRNAIMELTEPILMRNLLRKLNGENSWEILNWDLQTLAEMFGDKPLPFRAGYRAQTTKPQWEIENRVEWFTIKDLLKKQDFCNWYYFDYKYMHEWCKNSPQLLNSLNWNRFGFDLGGKDSTIWIGNEGAHTNCHQDSYGCNLVTQIHGKKEWILFPPEAAKSLRPSRVPYEESTIYSSINFYSPSEEEENHLKNIPGARVVILEPGEVLFIPKGWWHYVESLNLSVSVNIWLPLKTDCKARLKEALVKLMINGIGKNIPSSSENDTSSIQDSLNYVKTSIEECSKQKINAAPTKENGKNWTPESLANAYPFFAFLLPSLDSQELQKKFADKRKRFSVCINNSNNTSLKQENLDSSNQLLIERIFNAFCDPNIIEEVAGRLLNEFSRS